MEYLYTDALEQQDYWKKLSNELNMRVIDLENHLNKEKDINNDLSKDDIYACLISESRMVESLVYAIEENSKERKKSINDDHWNIWNHNIDSSPNKETENNELIQKYINENKELIQKIHTLENKREDFEMLKENVLNIENEIINKDIMIKNMHININEYKDTIIKNSGI